MRLIFAGTPDFAVPALAALMAAGHEIVLVLTQPDRPAGRGMKLKASPVKLLAQEHSLAVYQPVSLKAADVQEKIASVNADLMIVAAYGLIIPTPVLNMPRLGCLNIHASLLPRWRGAAPIQRSLLAGDAETGITIMQVVPALDAGAMLMKGYRAITESDTAQTLHDDLAALGGEMMVQAITQLETLTHEDQDTHLVTYAEKLQKDEAPIDWNKPAIEISRQVRAFNPFPVAQTNFNGETIRVWFARSAEGKGRPGEVLAINQGIIVACGEGALRIEELQKSGGKRLPWKDFLAGIPLIPGDRFTT